MPLDLLFVVNERSCYAVRWWDVLGFSPKSLEQHFAAGPGSPVSSGSRSRDPEMFPAAWPTPPSCGSGEALGSCSQARGSARFCCSRLALPCAGVSCFSYIVAWESCVTVKRVTISLSELLPSRCRVLESSQQTSTADTLLTCSFSLPSTCTYLNNQRT